ncbi:phage GP46 family protein [Neisseria shayeganii]|uniref:Phage GP46 family protein n=1 Tax=Neisseria shayeganii TaxID=607712 RepID=A0A7D7SHF0_9NEIS|nr:phage GP46 family protein [Neisseria shayeganii]QMT40007.1 phage GP46 family protein [Neisseria shayeganii]
MDALLDPYTGDYVADQSATGLENETYIRLMTPLGSYWGDPALGSRLHELRRQKHLTRVEVLARQYAEQALQPMLSAGRARSVAVSAALLRPGWLKLHVAAVDPGGRPVNLDYEVSLA